MSGKPYPVIASSAPRSISKSRKSPPFPQRIETCRIEPSCSKRRSAEIFSSPGQSSCFSEQQLMMDVTGKPFPQFMQETVFKKIGMHDSSYQQPLPADRAAHAATGPRENGQAVEGKWHVYPEMAAAGLWTTPTDLAKFGIEIA